MATTPTKAIRKHCLWCCCNSAEEVRNCLSDDCVLYPMRMGHLPKDIKVKPVKAIREFCLMCVDGPAEVERCQAPECELYRFRFGKNPRASQASAKKNANLTEEEKKAFSERMKMLREGKLNSTAKDTEKTYDSNAK